MFKRGQVYYVDLTDAKGAEQGKLRPCIVVSNNMGSKYAPILTVVPVTSKTKKPLPTHVTIINEEAGLAKGGTILCEQIRTIDKKRVGSYMGELHPDTVAVMNSAIKIALAVD